MSLGEKVSGTFFYRFRFPFREKLKPDTVFPAEWIPACAGMTSRREF
jgi:hypothetical protein